VSYPSASGNRPSYPPNIGDTPAKANLRLRCPRAPRSAMPLRFPRGRAKASAGTLPEWLGYYRPIPKAVTLRLDADVLAWRMVPRQGRGHQTRINRGMRKLMSEEKKISDE
jgi:uncharacterized protein (DUF4415 family)